MQRRKLLITISLLLCSLLIFLLFGLLHSPRIATDLPSIQQEKRITVLAEDLRNGGILGVVTGIMEATKHTQWEIQVYDASSDHQQRITWLSHLLELKPDALVLVGMDATLIADYLKPFEQNNIPIVGWHVAPYPGAVPGLPVMVNVTTDSREVAFAAAAQVKPATGETAGVIIFMDSQYEIAQEKANLMKMALEKNCQRCEILKVVDIPLGEAATLMPTALRSFQQEFGDRWTHSLAINDLYFDHAIREFVASDRLPPQNISAGDGSPSALLRMKYHSFQQASVAEPLLMHGWQIVDELQRIFSDKPPSGYVNPPYVVTQTTAHNVLNEQNFFEPNASYRNQYLTNWKTTPNG